MEIEDLIFVDNLPKLDLHGETRETIVYLINSFINDNAFLKNEFVTIVHGKGSGALKNKTREILKKNKQVCAFKTYYYNEGCTIVKINLKKT
jgi:dsDNA-specific endonuclease/ATPase MutS2